jgi:hypothetical protein
MTAFARDVLQLESLQSIKCSEGYERISINLDWPQEIDEGEFLRRMKQMPKAKTFKFLS